MPQIPRFAAVAALALAAAASSDGAITINGVSDRAYYTNTVTFTVPNEAGFTIVANLDGQVINASTPYTLAKPSYHELNVTKTPTAGGTPETRRVQFIIRDGTRNGGGADTGLPTWVPVDPVDAPPAVIDAASLQVVIPRRVPAGTPIPVIYRLTEAGGQIAKLMATAVTGESSGSTMRHRLWRGAGCGTFPAIATPGDHTLNVGWPWGNRGTKEVTAVDPAGPADILVGTLAADFTNAQPVVNVTGNVNVPAGRTLRLTAGTIVRLAASAEFDIAGSLVIEGTPANPVLFCPAVPGQRWGGLWAHGTSAQVSINGAIFTGGCASSNWLSQAPHDFGGHHVDQPILTVSNLAPATVAMITDSAIVDNLPGQAFHTESANLTITRCLVQRATTGGQCDNGSVKVIESHLVEMNLDNGVFEDDDNDGLYMTGGAHEIRRSVICFCKDDGLDSGSGPGGTMLVDSSWIESCWHEAMAWSNEGNARIVTVTNTVSLNSGQGIECGFGGSSNGPQVTATGSLFAENAVGTRFGDNYDWDYPGHLTVRNSFIIQNRFHDVWGMNWASGHPYGWTYHAAAMTIEDNIITEPNSFHPNNTFYAPGTPIPGLAALIPSPAGKRGVAVIGRPRQNIRSAYGGQATVRLDRPATSEVRIPWKISALTDFQNGTDVEVAAGEVIFNPGESTRTVDLPVLSEPAASAPWVAFSAAIDPASPLAAQAEFTGNDALHFTTLEQEPPAGVTLIPAGATWRYYDDGDIGAAQWKPTAFDDSSWESGPAELGFDDGQATEINDTFLAYYFRHRFNVPDPADYQSLEFKLLRDDGAVVYLNGAEIWRTNMPESGVINYSTPASSTINGSAETVWHVEFEPATSLVAGENSVAVEVHQRDAGSSDVSFNLELIGHPPLPDGVAWAAAALDETLYLFWTSGATPSIPQTSDDLVNWVDRPDLQSPIAIKGSDSRAFFRLVTP